MNISHTTDISPTPVSSEQIYCNKKALLSEQLQKTIDKEFQKVQESIGVIDSTTALWNMFISGWLSVILVKLNNKTSTIKIIFNKKT